MKPARLSGFPELLPEQRAVELAVLDELRRVFELHGFVSLETRAVEPLDQLLRKGDIAKEIYVLKRLHAEDGDAGLGLHFDLTVPFARYVAENSNDLQFPLRRYQIQKVWRGERPQHGRYREFTQADIDIVGRETLPLHFDVEVAQVMAEALSRLQLPAFTLQLNNRKILDGFYQGLGVSDVDAVMRVVDKLDKVPADTLRELLLTEAGVNDSSQANKILELAQIVTTDTSFVQRIEALGVTHPLLSEGLNELATVMNAIEVPAGITVQADLRIARGLDYYTGTVFETRLEGYEHLGSVCSGGRYERLASDGRNTYPGVGISLGVSRLLIPLIADGLVADRTVPSAVLVTLADEESRTESNRIAQRLRARGIATEVAPKADKFGKQLRYAQRRGIPFAWFVQEHHHEVKDIRSGEQNIADPDQWTPPVEDLRPRIKEITE